MNRAARSQAGVLAEFADRFDAVVACAVDFDDVDVLADGDRPANVAFQARVLGRPVHAIEAFGEDSRDRGFADAARAAEKVGVRDPIEPNRVAERLNHVILTDDVLEALRSISARRRYRLPPISG